MTRIRHWLGRLRRDESGIAFVEFAYSLVFLVPIMLGGLELTNYVVAKMRVSQIALHVADNASRIGIDSLLSAPKIYENQINDLFIGANLQAGSLNLATRGRVILSSVEPDPSNSGKYMIRWQRCYGSLAHNSSYGTAGTNNRTAFGPTGRQVKAPTGGGVMLVEIKYDYQPLLLSSMVSSADLTDTAAMVVRDDRDFSGPSNAGVYPVAGVTASSC